MAIKEVPTFPYMSEDSIIAPYTDGTLDDGNSQYATFLPLTGATAPAQAQRKLSGQVVKGYIGCTDMIFTDKIANGQIAGDS